MSGDDGWSGAQFEVDKSLESPLQAALSSCPNPVQVETSFVQFDFLHKIIVYYSQRTC